MQQGSMSLTSGFAAMAANEASSVDATDLLGHFLEGPLGLGGLLGFIHLGP